MFQLNFHRLFNRIFNRVLALQGDLCSYKNSVLYYREYYYSNNSIKRSC